MRLLGKFLAATGGWLAAWPSRTRLVVIFALCWGLLGASVFKLVTAWAKLGEPSSPADTRAIIDPLTKTFDGHRFESPDPSLDRHGYQLDSLARIYPFNNHPMP